MKRFQPDLNLTTIIVLLAVGVLLPVMLATAAGIVALVIAGDTSGIVTGVLVVSFAVTAMGSALVTVVLTGKKARLARLQADLVANVSHEFRTPLSAIRLYAQTLQSGKLAGDPRQTDQCLAAILRETEWLDVMVDRVLTWRASAKDMMKFEMTTQPVLSAVRDAVERFQSMVVTDEVEFSFLTDSRLCVRHDVRALSGVVLNLLTNAYKYTGKTKQIRVEIRDDGDQVVIDVTDNGVGLTPAEAKRVFQPFYRAAGEDGREASGVGLGLSVARHLVDRHQGALTVRSEKGKGATFSIHLPAVLEGSE